VSLKATGGLPAGADLLAGGVVAEPGVPRDATTSQESGGAVGSRDMTEPAEAFGLEEVGPHNYRCEVVIANDQGFHMRPVTEFAALAQTFESKIIIHKGNQTVDGKDPFDMLMLEAVAGTPLVLEGRGPDAPSALAALARLVRSGFPERKPAS
jgi:phosphocarrier protein HPr